MHRHTLRPTVGPIHNLPRAVARRWPTALAIAAVAVGLPTGVALANPPQTFPDGITAEFIQITGGGGIGEPLIVNGANASIGVSSSGAIDAVDAQGLSNGVIATGRTGVLAVGTGDGFGVDAQGPTAVRAQTFGPGDAVQASSDGTSVRATSRNAAGVVASSLNADGIDASSTNGAAAVFAQGNATAGSFGAGVVASGDEALVARGVTLGLDVSAKNTAIGAASTNGIGLDVSGKEAPIRLFPASTAGAPTAGPHHRGELYVDSNGALFFCTADGTPGTWKHVVLQ